MQKQEGMLILTGFRERWPTEPDHVFVRPFDASEAHHAEQRSYARWTDGEKPPSEPMRIVFRSGLRILLRPLRFYERWYLKFFGEK